MSASDPVDLLWHSHQLHTTIYHADMKVVVGRELHHDVSGRAKRGAESFFCDYYLRVVLFPRDYSYVEDIF